MYSLSSSHMRYEWAWGMGQTGHRAWGIGHGAWGMGHEASAKQGILTTLENRYIGEGEGKRKTP
ncbi:MAG: hypothetical protein EAZ90_13275 [Oscillatoriales cyanobacterium]|nr:MAG: hypothetical protein EAZ94_03495 [Oscillatoriales cyanobacterium]TAE26098.1 MAG: hypothetical protein EAZ93_09110 [Oscillatoriales cyanobacterium]TAE42841.1 MAG: hypothetical protein EAZ90_13275 [Oscillatoriales cyanobacterium]TAE55651.1 MAG: hypothetical protein EAZ88_05945 [Oscillatoriales cyanobacterium]TAG05066.1 MAG: hypothetical protein EAZ45_06845 [Oscillatoriales cyanobacterium]